MKCNEFLGVRICLWLFSLEISLVSKCSPGLENILRPLTRKPHPAQRSSQQVHHRTMTQNKGGSTGSKDKRQGTDHECSFEVKTQNDNSTKFCTILEWIILRPETISNSFLFPESLNCARYMEIHYEF